jgi:spermidine synthase
VCQEIAVFPFLWVAPLSLYLVSFIICFDREKWYSRHWYGLGTLIAVTVISAFSLANYYPPLFVDVTVYFVALFCVCMVCHGELVLRKPTARHLTLFYLMCSAGGALGGVFVALVCPHVFSGYFEMNGGLVVAYVTAALAAFADQNIRWWFQGAQRRRAVLYVSVGFLCVLLAQVRIVADTGIVACRNFYGVLRLKETKNEAPEQQGRYMVHGGITHGFQFFHPRKRRIPTTYFTEKSGIGIVMREFPRQGPIRVGVIGLGIGTITAYARSGDYIRYYEIDPDVERLARRYFSFLDDTQAEVEVVIGDARLSMEREPSQQFDVFVLDAFSGDAIPAHLLTKEAFEVYRRHLHPDGVIAVHISNRHLDLCPVVAQLAEYYRMQLLYFLAPSDSETHGLASEWCVMSNNRQFLDNKVVRKAARDEARTSVTIPIWTDQFNSLFRLLRY